VAVPAPDPAPVVGTGWAFAPPKQPSVDMVSTAEERRGSVVAKNFLSQLGELVRN